MAHLTAFEAGTRVTAVLRGSAATMRYFNADLVSHKVTLVVLGHALFGGFAAIEFLSEDDCQAENSGTRQLLPRTTNPYPTLFTRCIALVSVTILRAYIERQLT